MELDGIDGGFSLSVARVFSGAVEDPQLAAAMCRAYNRWLADYCRPYPDRLFGVAMLPMQSVELAIDECAMPAKDWTCAEAFCGRTVITAACLTIRPMIRSGRGTETRLCHWHP